MAVLVLATTMVPGLPKCTIAVTGAMLATAS